jgi:hypothetical protein
MLDISPAHVALMFPTLTPAQIARIAAHGRERPIARGEVLIEAGDPALEGDAHLERVRWRDTSTGETTRCCTNNTLRPGWRHCDTISGRILATCCAALRRNEPFLTRSS